VKIIKVKQTGYSGLMLPVLEDSILSALERRALSVDAILSYSRSALRAGYDSTAGGYFGRATDLIIGDMASLAFKWHKPLAARLLPVAGKGPGDVTDFDDPFLANPCCSRFRVRQQAIKSKNLRRIFLVF